MSTRDEALEDDVEGTYTCMGLRYAHAYELRCRLRVRARREGTLLEILLSQGGGARGESRSAAEARWAAEVDAGRVRVVLNALKALPNGGEPREEMWKRLDLRARVPAGSLVETIRHVHERVVSAAMPRVIAECDRGTGLIFVEKPAGVPVLAGVAPGESGKLNCVELLSSARRAREIEASTSESSAKRARVDLGRVWAVNRIDAPVSGVWLAASSAKAAAKAREWLNKTSTGKTYLARVSRGSALETPADGLLIDAPLRTNEESSRAEVCPESEGGKPCATRIFLLERFPEDDTALVVARLETNGRYHQIRAHLASIGHPIANDTAYNDDVSATADEASHAGRAYRDDERGGVASALARARDPRCAECDALIALCASTDDTTKPLAGKSIFLHAVRYQFRVRDVEFDARSPSLPAFARGARLRRVDDLIHALPPPHPRPSVAHDDIHRA